MNRPPGPLLCSVLLALPLLACNEGEAIERPREAVVAARDLVVSARAAGTIAPIVTVDVKSQASGEITEVLVDEGDVVRRGDLLVRVDPRIPRNAVTQAEADSVVSAAALENAESRLRRAEELFREQAITEEEFETARLARASAVADRIRSQRALEDARIAFIQTEVRAPSPGVILSRAVEVGSVIASASRDVGGGAVLLRMALLDEVEVRAFVDERDIGRIHQGLDVSIQVAAFPRRPFAGRVLRVGAEAVVEQNVTTFPVIVRIPNRQGLLKPGMNAEVEIVIAEARDALTVPNAALRLPSELAATAELVGVPADSLEAMAEALDDRDLVTFVVEPSGIRLQPVRTGLTDFDHSVVEAGLEAGDRVLLLPTAGLLAERLRRQEWVQQRVGGGPLGRGGD